MCVAHTVYINELQALPEKRFAFDCLLQCCWVESGKDGVTNLSPIIKWTFDNEGI